MTLQTTNFMKITFYFKASQSPTLKAQGMGFIYYYIIINNRKSPEKTTKIKCHRDDFNTIKGCFVGNDAEKRNKRLAQITEVVEKNKLIKEALGEDISVETVEISVHDRRMGRTFKSVMKEYLDQQFEKIRKEGELKHKGNIEQSTFETYEKRNRNIEKFLKAINKENLLISQFDERMCEMFDNYMTSKLKCGQAYSTKHIKLVRTVSELARRSNIIKVNFTENYKLKHEGKKKVKTLHMNDYKLLNDKRTLLNDTELRYVDILIFMRETFLNYGDYIELEQKHLQIDESGKTWIIKARKKRIEEDRQIQMIPLSKIALEFIEKYGGIENIPKRSLATINRNLKFIFKKVGINKNVSTKMGRSSGISKKFNFDGLRPESIAFVAGWTSTREMDSYLEIDTEQLSREFLRDF